MNAILPSDEDPYKAKIEQQLVSKAEADATHPNNTVINNPDYYRLPCGRYLEDYIAYCDLDFFVGSALKYVWRAGKKFGESREKDLEKARHYCEFIARRNGATFDEVSASIKAFRRGAENWDGRDFEA